MKYSLVYKEYADKGLLIEWPQKIDTAILEDIINFRNAIIKFYKDDSLECIPAYNSLMIVPGKGKVSIKELKVTLENIYHNITTYQKRKQRLWTVPVCYDTTFGMDLEVLSQQKKITKETLIKLHTEAVYTIYCIGFLPGFMYLGGLPKKLNTPRREEPRLYVPKGSVGIGGDQTGIYPQDSPGGWHIIGNSPIDMFDAKRTPPCKVEVGDKIQFKSISVKNHELIKIEMAADVFKLKNIELS